MSPVIDLDAIWKIQKVTVIIQSSAICVIIHIVMESQIVFSEKDKLQWKKIKRNGSFTRKRKNLIENAKKLKKSNELHPGNATVELLQAKTLDDSNNLDWLPTSLDHSEQSSQSQEAESNSDSDDNDFNVKEDMTDFRDDLKSWAIQFQIKHAALNSLLTLLKSHIADNVLPKDARTLVGTPRNTNTSADISVGGEYWHYGLRKVLNDTLSSYDKLPSKLSLNVNIDGLPTFKSSTTSFWPILVNIHELRRTMTPLVVGVFCGACN